jgi:hypothetical protein
MPELNHHPESESRYSCSHCEETGIDIESREYCTACELGKRRMNLDRLAEPLRHHSFTNAMWIAHHSAMKTERAIAAADLALLKSKLLQAERDATLLRAMIADPTLGYRWRMKDGKQQWQAMQDGETFGKWGEFREVMNTILAAKEQAK